MSKQKMDRLYMNLPESKKKDYRKQAERLGLSLTEFILDAADDYLNKTREGKAVKS